MFQRNVVCQTGVRVIGGAGLAQRVCFPIWLSRKFLLPMLRVISCNVFICKLAGAAFPFFFEYMWPGVNDLRAAPPPKTSIKQ